MTAGFTQGPWRKLGLRVLAPDNQIVCVPELMQPGLDTSEPHANACLIAAAPEMDEMLGEVIDVLEGMNDDEINEEFLPRIRAVRAKARGEQA